MQFMRRNRELQSNNNTLKSIISSSRMISDDFYRKVGIDGEKGVFSGFISEILLPVLRFLCIYNNFAGRRNQGKNWGELFNGIM